MRKRTTAGIRRARQGQAILELVIGLVALMAVTMGLILIGQLGRAHTQAMIDARAEAGDRALASQYVSAAPGPVFLYDWTAGPDDRTHSRDDRPVYAFGEVLRDDLVTHAKPEDLEAALPDNLLSDIRNGASALESFNLVHGHEESDPVPLLPVVRRLFYNAESIEMEADAWLGWGSGIP